MSEFVVVMAAPFVACVLIAGIHTYLGIHVLVRGVIFVDLALAQIAALGRVVGFAAGYELGSWTSYIIALAATILAAAIFAFSRMRRARIPQEAIIGVVYVVASAAGILVIDRSPHGAEHLKSMLTGSIMWESWTDVLQMAVIFAVVGVFHWLFRKRFMAISRRNQDSGRGRWATSMWDFLFFASFGLAINSAVEAAGVLLVFTFLIMPAICGFLSSARTSERLLVGWAVAAMVSLVGCVLSYLADLPTGAAMICLFGLVLIAFGGIKKRISPAEIS